jgi:hypothetical protein
VNPRIFAFGDVCQTSLNEPKSVIAISFLIDTLVKNILQTANGQRPSNQIPNSINDMCVVSLGPNYGILAINGMVTAGANMG